MLTGKHRHRHAEAQFARWVDDGRRDRRDAMDQPVDVDRPSFLPGLLDIVQKSLERGFRLVAEIGRASCRERVCQYVSLSVVAVSLKKKKVNIEHENGVLSMIEGNVNVVSNTK